MKKNTSFNAIATIALSLFATTSWASTLSFVGTGSDGKACTLSVIRDQDGKITSATMTGFQTSSGLPTDNETQPQSQTYPQATTDPVVIKSDTSGTTIKESMVGGGGAHGHSDFTIVGDLDAQTLKSATYQDEVYGLEILPLHGDKIECTDLSKQAQ